MNTLNTKERLKHITTKRYVLGEITRKQAAVILNVSSKTISKYKTKYLKTGSIAFYHGNNGKINSRRVDSDIESKIVNLYKENYYGFNFIHFYEHITIDTNTLSNITGLIPPPCSRTVFRILNRNGIGSPQMKKENKDTNKHPRRPRRTGFGELVQLDGSVHDWFETGEKSTLHLAVDDSTSKIVGAYFEKEETTKGYFEVLNQIIANYGIPKTFYTDNRSSFEYKSGKTDVDKTIQFKRVCTEFGIKILTTSVPQAKGRVERANRTLQDRLISELRFAKIKTIKDANKFLKTYISRYNTRFEVKNNNISFMPPKAYDIEKIISYKHPRKVLLGHVVSYGNKQYLPIDNNKAVLLGLNNLVHVVRTRTNKIYILHNEKYYEVKLVANYSTTAHKPADNHPWKNGR